MDLLTSLKRLEQLRDAFDAFRRGSGGDVAAELYGQLEEFIIRLDGVKPVQLEGPGRAKNTFSTYIESALSSDSRAHDSQARSQIIRLIGKVRGLLEDPTVPQIPSSVAQLVRLLQRFRECCQYVEHPPQSERQVQDILWIMLRAQFDLVEREETLAKFGEKNYRPDFGVPELGALVEVKYIGDRTEPGRVQDELLADTVGYLRASPKYSSVAFLVYDAAHKLRDAMPFVGALKMTEGVLDAIVVPGIG